MSGMKQPTLFETGETGDGRQVYAPSNWGGGSEDGAAKAQPHVQWECRAVLAALGRHGPMTREQLSMFLNKPQGPLCARLNSLVKSGQVREANYRQRSSKGVNVTVYEIAEGE